MTTPATLQDTTYVDSPRRLAAAVEAIRRAPAVGFDTEFVSEGSYQPQLCLLQLSTAEGIWVIDPLSNIDLADFWETLTAPGREVVALAARQEVLFCLRYARRAPETVFDPQIAAGLLGYGYPLSHTNLVRKVLNVRAESGEAFTDWRRRPLSSRQLEYAASDVRHLLKVRETLLGRAAQLGRTGWVRGECAASLERIIRSEQEERWWRLTGGVAGLRRRELGVLRELWRWRDNAARTADSPPRRILGDELLVEIAKRSPRSTADLFALRGLERPAVRRAGNEIVDAVRAGLALPDDQLPALLRRDDPPQVGVLAALMSLVMNGLAAEHEIDPALLATTADLQDLVRWHLAGGEGERPQVLEGWRGEILGRPLLEVLTGKSAVRVASVQSPNPLRIEAV